MFQRVYRLVATALVLFALVSCGQSTEEVAEEISDAIEGSARAYPEEVPLLKLPEGVTPTHYALDLTLDPTKTSFSGTVDISLDIDVPVFFFYMHGEDIQVTGAKLITDKAKEIGAQYHQVEPQGVARVTLDRPISPGAYRLELTFTTPYSERLDGIYRLESEGASYVFSQMQSISARRAFPCFDEPRFKTPFSVTLRVLDGNVAVTNGAELSVEPSAAGGMVYIFDTTQPVATELLAFAAGPFDVVEAEAIPANDLRDRPVPLRGIAPRGHGEKLQYLLDTTAPIFDYYESYFQQPYPFAKLDLIAVPDFQAGAMENPGAIMYQDSLSLVDDETRPESKSWILVTHAHEIAHQWFGNLVTPLWWDDIWLNESFAEWISAKASDELEPGWNFEDYVVENALGVMSADSLSAARRLRDPIETHDDIASIWDDISYSKGAGVLNMFEAYVGPDAFREGIRLHMERHAHGNADAFDFLNSLSDGAGRPEIATEMSNFLTQTGVPLLQMKVTCGEQGASATVDQSRSLPLGSRSAEMVTWSVPLCYRTDAGEACALVSQIDQKIDLGEDCPAFVMPNRGGRGYYRWSLDPKAFENLTRNLSQLTKLEKFSVLDSLEAGFQGGRLSGSEVIALIPSFAGDPEPEVVTRSLRVLRNLDDNWGKAGNKPDFSSLYKELYAHQFDALGLSADTALDKENPQGAADLRSALLYTFAGRVKDPDLRAQLTEAARVFTGYQRSEGPMPREVPRNLAGIALQVAHEELGAPFGEAMLQQLADATSFGVRERLIDGLTAGKDPAFGDRMVESFYSDEVLRPNETQFLLFNLMANETLQSDVMSYLSEGHHLQNFAKRLPVDDSWQILRIGDSICDEEGRQKYEAMVRGQSGDILGAERAIDQTLELIDQCIAVRAHLRSAANG